MEASMRLTKLGFTRRTLVTCLVLAALASGAFLALAPSPAAATSRCGIEYHYFSDATYTLQVGYQGLTPITCGCRNFKVGTTSRFIRTDTAGCF
jgi:hypothetical protein